MKLRATAFVSLALLATAPAGAGNPGCWTDRGCWFCNPRDFFDGCSVDCQACLGYRQAPSADAMPPALAPEPMQPLLPFRTELLGEATHPAVARVLDRFQDWSSQPVFKRPPTLDLAGGVAIDGKAHELTLQVRQAGEAQIYVLDIAGFAEVEVKIHPPAGGKQEIEFRFRRKGAEKGRIGHLMAGAP